MQDYAKCHECRIRYWQSARTHLCRQCEKEQEQLASLVLAADRSTKEHLEAIERLAAREAQLDAPKPTLVADGREFEIVWNGTTPLVWH